jgi:hypothetical protein
MDHSACTVNRPIRVFLLDDHEIVRRELTELLDSARDMSVVGEAGTATEALHRIPAVRPRRRNSGTHGFPTGAALRSAGRSALAIQTCGA